MIWLRPPAFAWYRQVSARWTSSAVEAPGPRARPPLTVKLMSYPATTTGAAAVAERTLSATIPDPRRSLQWVLEPADRSIKTAYQPIRKTRGRPIDYLQLPIETLKVGSIGTLHALGLAKDKGARFLLASTSECYGDPQVHPQPETYWGHVNPVGPRGVYDEAKRFGEALTMAYRRSHGVDTAIVRIFNTFGPRMRPNDGRAIPTFIRQALASEPLTVAGDGAQTRSVCYVDDLIEGLLRLLRSDLAGPVNIGNPGELSVRALAERIRALCASPSKLRFVARPEDDPTVRQPDITLARDTLGWEPKIELDDGLRRTIAWFRRLDRSACQRAPHS